MLKLSVNARLHRDDVSQMIVVGERLRSECINDMGSLLEYCLEGMGVAYTFAEPTLTLIKKKSSYCPY